MSDEKPLRRAVAEMRENYLRAGLSESDVADSPIAQFERWFEAAVQAGLREPNAMTLATATAEGRPAARIVLLKSFDEQGFVFYTNYDSRKGRELTANAQAALVFYWADLERQVRVEGSVVPVSRAESEAYFHSRPRGSQFGAWASRQSTVLAGREVLEAQFSSAQQQFGEGSIPMPPFWGGYRVIPDLMEFWQGRPSRLHDRIQYRLRGERWVRERLAP